jgi:branched-chain amino acid transport system permease protein
MMGAIVGAIVISYFCVGTSGIPFLMLTLAFSQLIFSIALKWRVITGGTGGIAVPDKPSLFGLDLADSLASISSPWSFSCFAIGACGGF